MPHPSGSSLAAVLLTCIILDKIHRPIPKTFEVLSLVRHIKLLYIMSHCYL